MAEFLAGTEPGPQLGDDDPLDDLCPECLGEGEVERGELEEHHTITCPRCNGTGRARPEAEDRALSRKGEL